MEPTTVFSVGLILVGCWQIYMVTCRPDTYFKLREQDRARNKHIVDSVGKAAGPVLLKALEKWLTKK